MTVVHACARAKTDGKCGGVSPKSNDRSLYIVEGGLRSCFQHLTAEERSYRNACTHSLAPTGRCSFCGQTGVPAR